MSKNQPMSEKRDEVKPVELPPTMPTFQEMVNDLELALTGSQTTSPPPNSRKRTAQEENVARGRPPIPQKTAEQKTLDAVLAQLNEIQSQLAATKSAPAPLQVPSNCNWSTTERTLKSYQAVALVQSGIICFLWSGGVMGCGVGGSRFS